MPFGKYKGQLIEDLPTDYMIYLCEVTDIALHRPSLYREINNQLKLRRGEGVVREK